MAEPVKDVLHLLLTKKKKCKFPSELKTFATTLQFYSSRAYNYVRKTFMNTLPHPQTIRRWFHSVNGNPGITTEAIETVKLKIAEAAKEGKKLYFSLMVDEMSIRRQIEWDGKEYHGFVDLGTGGTDNDELPEATYALVFMIVNVNGHFKIPVAYYLINGMTGVERANLLRECLLTLHEAQIHIVSLTLDGAASNFAMVNNMGANLSANNMVPNFHHPASGEKIYVLLDACHMLKLVRNALASKGSLADGDGNSIRWDYMEQLVQKQEEEGLHAATKIRRRHLNWQREKMKVEVAAQVFSTSVANALEYCEKDMKFPEFAGATATANFCRHINDIFDFLNSRNKFCKNPSQQPITRQNLPDMHVKVSQFKEYLRNLKDGDRPILESNRKTGFLGLILCMESILGLAEMLFKSTDVDYLLAYKFSQDHLETFFSSIRSRGGFNNNPSCRQFKYAYRRLLVRAYIDVSSNANSVPVDNTTVLDVSTVLHRNEGIDDIVEEVFNPLADHDYFFNNEWCSTEYVADVVAYISGFVVRAIRRKIRCTTCLDCLTAEECPSLLQKRKCRGGLIPASEDVVTVCGIGEKIVRTFKNMFTTKNILHKMIVKALAIIPSYIFGDINHMMEQGPLSDHRTQLLKLILEKYFTVRLHHEGTSRKDAVVRIRNYHNKLVLFQNQ